MYDTSTDAVQNRSFSRIIKTHNKQDNTPKNYIILKYIFSHHYECFGILIHYFSAHFFFCNFCNTLRIQLPIIVNLFNVVFGNQFVSCCIIHFYI